MDKRKCSWADIEEMISALVAGIKASGKEYDRIITISKGGLIPAYYLASRLGINRVSTVCLSSYDEDGQRGNLTSHDSLWPLIEEDIETLIVDDICDSGETLKALIMHYKSHADTVTLINKSPTFSPTYYADVASIAEWVEFPWEIS